jgi:hypothetical protein
MLWLTSSTSETELFLLLDKFHEAKTIKIETNKWQSKLFSFILFFFPFPRCGFQIIGNHFKYDIGSRDSAVGIATGYGPDDRGVGVRFPVEARIFFSPCRPDRF